MGSILWISRDHLYHLYLGQKKKLLSSLSFSLYPIQAILEQINKDGDVRYPDWRVRRLIPRNSSQVTKGQKTLLDYDSIVNLDPPAPSAPPAPAPPRSYGSARLLQLRELFSDIYLAGGRVISTYTSPCFGQSDCLKKS